MSLGSLYLVFLLLIIWGAQLKLRPFLRSNIKKVFWFSLLLYLLLPSYYSQRLFIAGLNSEEPTRFFYPPYQGISYFLSRISNLYWLPTLISLILALLILFLLLHLKPDLKERLFHKEEPYLIALSIALVGHPLWLIYIILTLSLYLLFSAFKGWRTRTSFYFFWLPSAALVLLLSPLLKSLPFISPLLLSSSSLL